MVWGYAIIVLLNFNYVDTKQIYQLTQAELEKVLYIYMKGMC